MKEELAQLDADLKGLFAENKLEEMKELLLAQSQEVIKELNSFYCNVIRKYYETKRFDLLLTHIRFVAFSCYVVELTNQLSLISKEEYLGMMKIYNEVYELKSQQ